MATALTLCTPNEQDRLLDLMSRFAAETGLSQTPEARQAAILPLLDGHPYGMAYLLGPARAPVGYVVVTMGWSLSLGGLDARIDEIFVRPSIRRRGIASEVLQALAVRLQKAGVMAIHLDPGSEDPVGTGIYRKAGFVSRDGYHRMTRLL